METTDNTRKTARGNGREPRLPVDAPSLDLAKYRDLSGDVEISDKEFDAFLATLAEVMAAFVHNAWDVRVIPVFLPEIFDGPSGDDPEAVDSDDDEDTDDEA